MLRRLRFPSGLKLMNLLLGGWTGVVFAFLYIPTILLAVFSVSDWHLQMEWAGFTLDAYRELLEDEVMIGALKSSLIVALITTALSVVLGASGAWLLHQYRFPFRRALNTLIFVPMAIPEVIMGISLLILFSIGIGWMEAIQEAAWAPQWLADWEFGLGYISVVISHTTFCFPFVLVAVQARLAGVDPALHEAAMDLGATPWRAFRHVMLPYMMPAIVAGALMAFTLSIDEYIVTSFTAGADSQTLPIKIFGRVKKGLDPSLNAISTVFILATALLVVISEWLKRSNREVSHR